MELIAGSNIEKNLENHYLLLDSDFISELYENLDFLSKFLSLLKDSHLMLDHMVAFEFLRDVFDPKYRKAKEKFIDSEMFNQTNNHVTVFNKIQDTALLLSKIYAVKGKSKGVSVTDLYLAARMMTLPENSLLITGNKRHYPSCIFKLVSVINIENRQDDSITNFCILKFDKEAFNLAYDNLLKIDEQNK